MYSNKLGRFTVPDPMISSGKENSPQSWNRFIYVTNNPLIFVDLLGLYKWGKSLQDDDKLSDAERAKRANLRGKFEAGVALAKRNLEVVKGRYGKDSDQYKEASRGVNVYGEKDDSTKVLVEAGTISSGGSVPPKKNSDGYAVVTFDEGTFNKQDYLFQGLIGHEGTHLDDVLTGRRSGMSQYESEFNGNYVQSVLSEAMDMGTGLSEPRINWHFNGLGGGTLYDSSWGLRTIPINGMMPGSSNLDIKIGLSDQTRREAVDAVVLSGYGVSKTNPNGKNKK